MSEAIHADISCSFIIPVITMVATYATYVCPVIK